MRCTRTLSLGELVLEVRQSMLEEVLTKQWLAGVRKGWLSLMTPRITAWRDVHKALHNLDKFVKNLKEQITYVRTGPSRFRDDKFEDKVLKALRGVELAVQDAKSRAEHWNAVANSPGGLSSFTKESGEQMFSLYQNDFEDAVTSYTDRAGRVTLTKLMDKVLVLLRADAKAAASVSDWTPNTAFKEFALQGIKVIVDDTTMRPGMIEAYIPIFLQVKKLLDNRKLGKLWYGQIFIRCKECMRGHGGGFAWGSYRVPSDTVAIYQRPGLGVMHTLIHEFAHRWWFKHMNSEGRARFTAWVEAGLSPVSAYGGRMAEEAFAEVFTHYVHGKSMTPQQLQTFKIAALRESAEITKRLLK